MFAFNDTSNTQKPMNNTFRLKNESFGALSERNCLIEALSFDQLEQMSNSMKSHPQKSKKVKQLPVLV